MRRVLSIRISYHLLRQKQLRNGTGYGGEVYAPKVAKATTDCRKAAGERYVVYLSALFLASSLELSLCSLLSDTPLSIFRRRSMQRSPSALKWKRTEENVFLQQWTRTCQG